eukprot:CAMPEP_0172637340 /NCGR_PEP_ID=MMETSP1068-20121228/208524_1 /TAXON_ID=35684 /ORGANISM="Pseudopedinella elastica, Strain CCMP716" /LENGTH=68 /DNA_ID=CAMNT_0013449967 /DNA_START=584 /DNA_END=790 /DNA_ORIENTATION=+
MSTSFPSVLITAALTCLMAIARAGSVARGFDNRRGLGRRQLCWEQEERQVVIWVAVRLHKRFGACGVT